MTEPWGLGLGAAIVAGAWLGPMAVLPVVGLFALFQILQGRRNLRVIGAIALATLLGAFRMAAEPHEQAPLNLTESSLASITVETYPRMSSNGSSVIASVHSLGDDDGMTPVTPFKAWVWLPGGVVAGPGAELLVGWNADSVSSTSPGFGSYIQAHGADAIGYAHWVEVVREESSLAAYIIDLRVLVTDGLINALPGDVGALAAGIVTGDDSHLSEQAQEAFLRTGTSHITAVSGSNVAMVLAIWSLVLPAGRARRRLPVQIGVVASIWFYALLVGLEPPAMRAAILATLVLFAGRFGRRPDLLTLLALTSAAMVLWDPNYVRLTSFWLSVVASAAIVMRVPVTPAPGMWATLRGMAAGVAMAQIATLPIVLMSFGSWSMTGVVANLVLAPLTWVAFPLCFALAGAVLVVPVLAPVVAFLPYLPLFLILETVSILSSRIAPLNLEATGIAGAIAVSIPCLLAVFALSNDSDRWARIVRSRWNERPVLVGSVIAGPITGLLVAGTILLMEK